MGWGRFRFRIGCARAGEFLYYFIFVGIGNAPYHSKPKKMAWANLAARADPKSGLSFFFLGHAACLVYTAALDGPSSQRRARIGLSP